MLVPDLKERLLTNLIVKVLNNFKFSVVSSIFRSMTFRKQPNVNAGQ